MANSTELIIKIVTDASGASAGIASASSRMDRLQSSARRMLPAAAAVAAGLVAVGTKAVKSASDLEQSQGAIEAVYGKAAAAVDEYAQTSVDRLGISEAAYKNYSALVGAALQNAGFSAVQAASMSDKAMVRAADMAATFGGTTSEAIDAINAAVSRAEFDPLEKYGVSLNQTAVNAELAKRGQDDLTGAALKQAKAQATLDLIYKQTGKAAGQFARESDTVAGQQQRAAAAFENAAASLGTALLPAVATVAEKLAAMAGLIADNSGVVVAFAGVLAGLAAAVFLVNAAFAVVSAALKVYRAAIIVTTAVTKALGVVSRITWISILGPIGLVVAAIAAIIAIVVVLWNKFPPFRNAVLAVWRAIKTAAQVAWRAIRAIISTVLGWARGYIRAHANIVRAVFRAIRAGGVAAWRGIRAVIATVIGWAKGFLRGYGNLVRSIWRGIRTAAVAAWRGVRSVIASVVNGTRGLLRGLQNVANAVWRGIRSAASSAFRGIRSIVSSTVSAIRSILNSVRSAGTSAWAAIRSAATSAFNAILGPVRAVQSAINSVISAVRSLVSALSRIKVPKISLPKLPNPFSASAPAAAFAAAPAGFQQAPSLLAGGRASGVGAGTTSSSFAPVVININGTLHDADAARAVRRVLRNDQRRRGGVTIERRRQTLIG